MLLRLQKVYNKRGADRRRFNFCLELNYIDAEPYAQRLKTDTQTASSVDFKPEGVYIIITPILDHITDMYLIPWHKIIGVSREVLTE